jgi:hypothetical protein
MPKVTNRGIDLPRGPTRRYSASVESWTGAKAQLNDRVVGDHRQTSVSAGGTVVFFSTSVVTALSMPLARAAGSRARAERIVAPARPIEVAIAAGPASEAAAARNKVDIRHSLENIQSTRVVSLRLTT